MHTTEVKNIQDGTKSYHTVFKSQARKGNFRRKSGQNGLELLVWYGCSQNIGKQMVKQNLGKTTWKGRKRIRLPKETGEMMCIKPWYPQEYVTVTGKIKV